MSLSQLSKRHDIQLCYPFSESRLFNRGQVRSRWTSPWLIQPKLNGERCRAIVSPEGRCLLFSSSAELITTLPHINQQLLSLPPAEYDGELYTHGWTFSQIHSAVSTKMSIHPDAPYVDFHIFDIVDESMQQIERLGQLNGAIVRHSQGLHSIYLVPWHIVSTLDEVMSLYDQFIFQGYEGFVLKELSAPSIRRRSPYWMKFKPRARDTYPISRLIEATSADGQPLSMLGAFECYDSLGSVFKVGAGKLTHSERREIFLEGVPPNSFLLVEYQTLSDAAGVPHFSRAVKVISPSEAEQYENC